MIRRAAAKLADEPDQPWGEFNSFHFVNRFIGNRRMGRYLGFDTRQMPMPGCHATPFQGHLLTTAKRETTFAPSYHFVTDLGTDEAWTNLPGGPSESRFSPFYKNDIIRWQTGTYKCLTPLAQPAVKADDSAGGIRARKGAPERLRAVRSHLPISRRLSPSEIAPCSGSALPRSRQCTT